ncbi:MAG: class I SAM-dependent methyltransferase [Firmicutes bacterium]|uniref:Methyltransferase domain-containing protein n=1 Tax=Melghirimyces thermohalophilus TaxID=1236220 RepID=A0A1G6NVD6_9BACL|nr:class I SAM-dependent methyltransferase [Melghirimyces thermohalophilus]MDA8353815.1 class I SAM-dependent methyltransferase [Bacillota bacterium]SDC71718.1 Methyltransferase domain-containing protein [Melghirimyces thermohalophilus]
MPVSLEPSLDRETETKFPYTEADIGRTELTPSYRVELRNPHPAELDRFIEVDQVKDWSLLQWKEIGKPYQVDDMAKGWKRWKAEAGQEMSVKTSWEHFNRSFHEWFVKDVPHELRETKHSLKQHLARFRWSEVKTGLSDYLKLSLWNYVQRVEDGVWDPRGKRALFQGLDLEKPRILFLGAAEGYEAMQLSAMYPGGEVVLVDYDAFCKTDRYGSFPETYPFLGSNPSTGGPGVWYKEQMNIHYIVDDIRNLSFGQEFDVVLSVGLLEHFPDKHKPEAIDWHRRFLKPGGYAILTTPRDQLKSRLYYKIMADVMNYTYRELMNIRQMGLYLYENGFDILRHGIIKVHNGIVAQPR